MSLIACAVGGSFRTKLVDVVRSRLIPISHFKEGSNGYAIVEGLLKSMWHIFLWIMDSPRRLLGCWKSIPLLKGLGSKGRND